MLTSVSQPAVQPGGGLIAGISVQPQGLAALPGRFLQGKADHGPAVSPACLGGRNAERVDDQYLLGRIGPVNPGILRQLGLVEDHAAPDRAVLLQNE